MKKNMGANDKAVRLIIAALLIGLYFTNTISGTFALFAIIVAIVFTITSTISFCPLYAILGISTCKAKK